MLRLEPLLLVLGGVALGVALIAAAFATGKTFGQSCAVEFPDKGFAWEQCVREMAQGSKGIGLKPNKTNELDAQLAPKEITYE